MSKKLGAYCTIRWNDSELQTMSGVYFSTEPYDEDIEVTPSGVPDENVFYYCDDEYELERMVNPDNTETDFTVLSIDEWIEEAV